MNKTAKEIQCLARLDELTMSNTLIMDFLQSEDLLAKDERRAMANSSDVPKALQAHLAKLRGNKLQLLTFEWSILPDERLKVTIITDRNGREFAFG